MRSSMNENHKGRRFSDPTISIPFYFFIMSHRYHRFFRFYLFLMKGGGSGCKGIPSFFLLSLTIQSRAHPRLSTFFE